jgi:type IV secretory pathway VirB4 component
MTHEGVVIGIDMLTANAFCWDPFAAYAAGLVSNPNVAVFGQPGQRKSTLIKTYLARMLGLYGDRRWVAVADPKGEYTPLADRLGLQVVRLSPGGGTRVNPLAPGPAAAHEDPEQTLLRRAETVRDLVATTLRRDLEPNEEAALHAAVDVVTRDPAVEPTLGDLAALLTDPTAEMAARLRMEPDQLARDCRDLYYGLASLLSHALRGMFDGPGTVRLSEGSRGVVLDLSGIDAGSRAMPVALMAATGWLQEYLACPGPQRLQVIDELWLGAGDRHFVRHMQRAVKLGRAYGTANIQIAHKVTDGAAQADSGTAEAKIAAGLLADCDTKVILRQDPEQLDLAQRAFGLTSTERDWIGSLARGRALWLVGGRRAVVQHHLASHERDGLVDTDQRMGLRADQRAGATSEEVR